MSRCAQKGDLIDAIQEYTRKHPSPADQVSNRIRVFTQTWHLSIRAMGSGGMKLKIAQQNMASNQYADRAACA